jgi:hypothetical protein
MFSLQLLPPVILFEIALLLNLADLPRLTSLVRYVELPQPAGIQTTKDKMFAIGAGSITFAAIGEKSNINLFQLNNVLHIPGMDANLFPFNDNKTPMTVIVGFRCCQRSTCWIRRDESVQDLGGRKDVIISRDVLCDEGPRGLPIQTIDCSAPSIGSKDPHSNSAGTLTSRHSSNAEAVGRVRRTGGIGQSAEITNHPSEGSLR